MTIYMNYKNRNKKNVWVGLEEQELKLYAIDKFIARLNKKKKKTTKIRNEKRDIFHRHNKNYKGIV